jgi:hypothetical protein
MKPSLTSTLVPPTRVATVGIPRTALTTKNYP